MILLAFGEMDKLKEENSSEARLHLPFAPVAE